MSMVEFRNVTKRFGAHVVLSDISASRHESDESVRLLRTYPELTSV